MTAWFLKQRVSPDSKAEKTSLLYLMSLLTICCQYRVLNLVQSDSSIKLEFNSKKILAVTLKLKDKMNLSSLIVSQDKRCYVKNKSWPTVRPTNVIHQHTCTVHTHAHTILTAIFLKNRLVGCHLILHWSLSWTSSWNMQKDKKLLYLS